MALNEPLVPLLLDDITEPQVVVPLALQSDQMCKCVSKSNVATRLTTSTQARGVPGLHLPHVSLYLAK